MAHDSILAKIYTNVLYKCLTRLYSPGYGKNQNILISGASVAGPALAWWLGRRGFRPTVVERAPHLRGGGYAVDFRGAAHLSVLAKMGILDQVRERQTHLSATSCVDGDGGPRRACPPGIFAGDVEILRGDLGQILYEATRDGTEYLFGDSVTGLRQDTGGVQVTFAPVRAAHLRPGRSGPTGCTPGCARWPSVTARNPSPISACTCAIFSVPDRYGLDHEGLLYSVPGKTAAVFSAPADRPGGGAVLLRRPGRAAARIRLPRPASSRRSWLTCSPTSAGTTAGPARAAARGGDDFYFDSVSQVRLDRWSQPAGSP